MIYNYARLGQAVADARSMVCLISYNYARLGLAVADARSMVRGSSPDLVAIIAVFDVSAQHGVWGIIYDEVGLILTMLRLLSSKAQLFLITIQTMSFWYALESSR